MGQGMNGLVRSSLYPTGSKIYLALIHLGNVDTIIRKDIIIVIIARRYIKVYHKCVHIVKNN